MRCAPPGFGTHRRQLLGLSAEMSTHRSDIDADHKRLDIARRLYEALVAQYPDRLITLCDGGGRVLARSEPRRKEDAAERVS
jgi:hypothetical protein